MMGYVDVVGQRRAAEYAQVNVGHYMPRGAQSRRHPLRSLQFDAVALPVPEAQRIRLVSLSYGYRQYRRRVEPAAYEHHRGHTAHDAPPLPADAGTVLPQLRRCRRGCRCSFRQILPGLESHLCNSTMTLVLAVAGAPECRADGGPSRQCRSQGRLSRRYWPTKRASAVSPGQRTSPWSSTSREHEAAGFGPGCHITNSAQGETICQRRRVAFDASAEGGGGGTAGST